MLRRAIRLITTLGCLPFLGLGATFFWHYWRSVHDPHFNHYQNSFTSDTLLWSAVLFTKIGVIWLMLVLSYLSYRHLAAAQKRTK